MKKIKTEYSFLRGNSEFKFIEANEIKVSPIYEYLKEKFTDNDELKNENGIEFVLFPDGSRGYRLTYKDDSKKLFSINKYGKPIEMIPYKDYVVSNSFFDKFSRLFGLTKELQYNKSKNRYFVNIAIFLTGALILLGIITSIF